MPLNPELLLHPLIPPPLHGVTPRTIKGKKWWDEKRKEAYNKHSNKCHACDIHKNMAKYKKYLEAHESYNIDYDNGIVRLNDIVALCHSCHNYIHSARMMTLVDCKLFSLDKANDIIQHGNRLVEQLPRNEVLKYKTPQKHCPWELWRIIIDGVGHYSRFKNEEEWSKYYNWININKMRDDDKALRIFRSNNS